MKTAAKVFIILGMIFGFYLIFPIIIGCLAIKRINQARDVSELKSIGIVTMFFCNLLGGAFMLCISQRDLDSINVEGCSRLKVVYRENRAVENLNKLENLSKLKDEGLLTEEEFQQKKKTILDNL